MAAAAWHLKGTTRGYVAVWLCSSLWEMLAPAKEGCSRCDVHVASDACGIGSPGQPKVQWQLPQWVYGGSCAFGDAPARVWPVLSTPTDSRCGSRHAVHAVGIDVLSWPAYAGGCKCRLHCCPYGGSTFHRGKCIPGMLSLRAHVRGRHGQPTGAWGIFP